jgi:hypothetical protein
MNRRALHTALFERLRFGMPSVALFTRRDLTGNDLSPQPALKYRPGTETPENAPPRAIKHHVRAEITLYARAAPYSEVPDESPYDLLFDLLAELETALKAQPGESSFPTTSLGGLCQSCSIVGPLEFFPGENSDQAVCRVPILLVVVDL